MAKAECPNFTRNGKQFIMTSTTRWSPEAVRKEELYAILKEKGYDHLFTINPQTLGTFIREQVDETANDEGETHIPDWLMGLVKSFEDIGITMKQAPRSGAAQAAGRPASVHEVNTRGAATKKSK
jgi:hypothetical protein